MITFSCRCCIIFNDHVEGFITPADEKRARVGWIATRIHREEMVNTRSDPPYGPESGLLFHSKKGKGTPHRLFVINSKNRMPEVPRSRHRHNSPATG